METDFENIDTWHELFDALCERNGFSDNMSLAARYCEMTQGRGQKHFDTAVRNFNNWRSGRHLPRLRSLKVLSQLLMIEPGSELMQRWSALYDLARADSERLFDDAPAARVPVVTASHIQSDGTDARRILTVLSGAALFSLGILAGRVWDSQWRPWQTALDQAPLITYLPEVRLVVGQSKIIHGERGDCGRLPRDWRDVWGNLPSSRIGEFSDAGVVRRYSMFCKGVTPARGIRFTASTAGTEEMYVTGDYVKITVVSEADLAPVEPANREAGL